MKTFLKNYAWNILCSSHESTSSSPLLLPFPASFLPWPTVMPYSSNEGLPLPDFRKSYSEFNKIKIWLPISIFFSKWETPLYLSACVLAEMTESALQEDSTPKAQLVKKKISFNYIISNKNTTRYIQDQYTKHLWFTSGNINYPSFLSDFHVKIHGTNFSQSIHFVMSNAQLLPSGTLFTCRRKKTISGAVPQAMANSSIKYIWRKSQAEGNLRKGGSSCMI